MSAGGAIVFGMCALGLALFINLVVDSHRNEGDD